MLVSRHPCWSADIFVSQQTSLLVSRHPCSHTAFLFLLEVVWLCREAVCSSYQQAQATSRGFSQTSPPLWSCQAPLHSQHAPHCSRPSARNCPAGHLTSAGQGCAESPAAGGPSCCVHGSCSTQSASRFLTAETVAAHVAARVVAHVAAHVTARSTPKITTRTCVKAVTAVLGVASVLALHTGLAHCLAAQHNHSTACSNGASCSQRASMQVLSSSVCLHRVCGLLLTLCSNFLAALALS